MKHEQIIEGLAMAAQLRGREEDIGRALVATLLKRRKGREFLDNLLDGLAWHNLTADMNRRAVGRKRFT